MCRRFYAIFHDTAEGAYAVEQDVLNVKNGPTKNFETADRLRRLHEYRQAWKALQWNTETVFDLKEGTVLRLHGSILAMCDIDAQDTRVDFLQVPSCKRNIVRKDWSVTLPNLRPVDIEVDTIQNLLMVAERK